MEFVMKICDIFKDFEEEYKSITNILESIDCVWHLGNGDYGWNR